MVGVRTPRHNLKEQARLLLLFSSFPHVYSARLSFYQSREVKRFLSFFLSFFLSVERLAVLIFVVSSVIDTSFSPKNCQSNAK